MKTFKKILLAFSCLLSLFLMVGCSTLTEEEKEEQRKLKTEYEMIGKEYIQNSLKDKYGQDFEVYNIKVKQSKGSFFHTSSGKYIPSMSAKASYNNQEIDVFASIRDGDRICYDNYQKQEILKDFNDYIYNLYNIKPKITWANLFVDIDDFGESFGMNSLKYNGNIEEYIKTKSKEIDVLLIYDELVDISKLNDSISYLFNNTNKFYILTSSNFNNENANKLMSNNKINHFLPYIKNYLCFKDGEISFIENNLKEHKYFYYMGENEAFDLLHLKNVNIHIDMWKDSVDYMDSYNRVSEWFWAEPDSTFYLKAEHIKNYSLTKKYYIFSKFKDENGNYVLNYEEINNLYSNYIVFDSQNEGWFTICEYNS